MWRAARCARRWRPRSSWTGATCSIRARRAPPGSRTSRSAVPPIRRTCSGSREIGRTPSRDRRRPGGRRGHAPPPPHVHDAQADAADRQPAVPRASGRRTCARTASTGSCSPAATSPTRSGPTSASGLEYVVEPEPLGTGGAIAYAAREAGISETFVACNGDVLTDLDLTALVAFHRDRGARMTIALHPVDDPSRYGVVATDARRSGHRLHREAAAGHDHGARDQRRHVRRRSGRSGPGPGGPSGVGGVRRLPAAGGPRALRADRRGRLARHRDARELPRREPRAHAPGRPRRSVGGRSIREPSSRRLSSVPDAGSRPARESFRRSSSPGRLSRGA